MKISIIIASYNCESQLKFTLNHVRLLERKLIEVIVVDGKSLDGTKELVASNQDIVDKFIYESDRGIADAWNKGINVSTSELIVFLNSGDYFKNDFIIESIKKFNEKTITYGNTYMFKGNKIRKLIDKTYDKNDIKNGFRFLFTSCAIPINVFKKIGVFDTSISIAIDTDFLVRASHSGINFKKINAANYMEDGGVSDESYLKAQNEFQNILRKNNVANSMELFLLKLKGYLYFIFAKNLKLHLIYRRMFMETTHFILYLINIFFRIIPSPQIRKLILSLLGMKIGKNSIIHRGIRIWSYGKIKIGDGVIVNRNCYFDNREKIKIGNHVSIAHDCKIYTTGHDINNEIFAGSKKQVIIKDYAVLFAGCVIMPGVKIGRGAIILPFSIVTKDVEDFDIVGGNPAIRKGQRELRDPKYELYYPYWYSN